MRTAFAALLCCSTATGLSVSWEKDILTIHGAGVPGGNVEVWYIEAYCRPNSHDSDWRDTVIPHKTELIEQAEDGSQLELRCTLEDGVEVHHRIVVRDDHVEFTVEAHNPTDRASLVHWAQPCIRVGEFTGHPDPKTYEYIRKSFVFLDGRLAMMPTKDWAVEARYTPGQVWAAPGVKAADANPRPLNPNTPSNGLIGCFSADDTWILASAWEPYQELFQGVIACLHSDFRIGGLEPGETKRARGKIYIMPADISELLRRYESDFPEQTSK